MVTPDEQPLTIADCGDRLGLRASAGVAPRDSFQESKMEFFLQSYVRTTGDHPFDFKGKFETATEVVEKLNSLFLAAKPRGLWNVLIQWEYLEAEDRYLNCIRIDSFVTNGNLSFISGDDVTTFDEFRRLFTHHPEKSDTPA